MLLIAKANEIFLADDLNCSEKYDLIFSKNISQQIYKIENFDYYDPGISYEEDVNAHIEAFNEHFNIC